MKQQVAMKSWNFLCISRLKPRYLSTFWTYHFCLRSWNRLTTIGIFTRIRALRSSRAISWRPSSTFTGQSRNSWIMRQIRSIGRLSISCRRNCRNRRGRSRSVISRRNCYRSSLRYYPFLYLESDCGADLLKRREARDAAQKCSIFDNFWP